MKKSTKVTLVIVAASVLAVGIFYLISPKYWWALAIASPIPPIP